VFKKNKRLVQQCNYLSNTFSLDEALFRFVLIYDFQCILVLMNYCICHCPNASFRSILISVDLKIRLVVFPFNQQSKCHVLRIYKCSYTGVGKNNQKPNRTGYPYRTVSKLIEPFHKFSKRTIILITIH